MKVLICIILVLLVLAAHGNGLFGDFVSDDKAYFAWLNTPTSIFEHNGNLRSIFSHIAFARFGFSDPFWFHLPSVVFHAIGALILYALVGFMGAAIFAVHPLCIEAITWISGGPYVYSSVLLLAALYFYKRSALWAFFLFLAAFLTSEKAIMFSGVLLLWHYFFDRVKDPSRLWIWIPKSYKKLIPFLLLSFIVAFNFIVFKSQERMADISFHYQIHPAPVSLFLTLPVSLTKYIELFIWPEKLCFYQPDHAFTHEEHAARLLIMGLFFVLIIYRWVKKDWQVSFWLSAFVISLVPVLLPFGLSWLVAERYVYFGCACLAAALGISLSRMGRTGWILFLAIIVSLSFRSWFRNRDWRNDLTLWHATAQYSKSAQTYQNLGEIYCRLGYYKTAEENLLKALNLDREYPEALHNLAVVYDRTGRKQEALLLLKEAARLNPNYASGELH